MSLNYLESGPDGAPTLLLVHPMGADKTFWDACRASWSRWLHCVAVDLRRADRPLSIEEHADDLEVFRLSRGLTSVVPVGCAVGAMVATAYAGMYPDRCGALVLSNPGYRTPPEVRTALAARAMRVRSEGLEAVAPDILDLIFLGCPDDERRAQYLKRFVRLDSESYALEIEGMLDADMSPHLPTITAPGLIVAGGNDRLLPPEQARRIAAELPEAEFVIVEDGAHFIPYQRPTDFTALVDAFLERTIGERASGPGRNLRM